MERSQYERSASSQSLRTSMETRSTHARYAHHRTTHLRPRRAAAVPVSGLGLPRGPVILEVCEATDQSGNLTFRFPTQNHGVLLAVRIPAIKAGYKAVLTTPLFNDASGKTEVLYEVRREPLSKRYDFRLPTGEHTVLAKETAKTYTLEAHDGHRLTWRQEVSGNFSLVSLPSGYVLAKYRLYTGPPEMRGGNFSTPADALRGALQVMPITAEAHDVVVPQRRRGSSAGGSSVHRTISATPSMASTQSNAPRLGPTFRTMAVGLVLPGLASTALVTPHASVKSTRQSELLCDELTNLGFGRLSMRPATAVAATQRLEDEEQRSAALEKKISDPRPRAVPLPLIAASLVAVLTAHGRS